MPTDTTSIYAPGNEAAWERAVRDALDKVRPGMGEAARSVFYGWGLTVRLRARGELEILRSVSETTVTIRQARKTIGIVFNPDPAEALRLALVAYRRAVEGVSDGD